MSPRWVGIRNWKLEDAPVPWLPWASVLIFSSVDWALCLAAFMAFTFCKHGQCSSDPLHCPCDFFRFHLCCAHDAGVRGLAVTHLTPARQPAIRLPFQIFTVGHYLVITAMAHRPWGTQGTVSGHLLFYSTTITSNFKVDLSQLFRVPTSTIYSLLTWDASHPSWLWSITLCTFCSNLLFFSHFSLQRNSHSQRGNVRERERKMINSL